MRGFTQDLHNPVNSSKSVEINTSSIPVNHHNTYSKKLIPSPSAARLGQFSIQQVFIFNYVDFSQFLAISLDLLTFPTLIENVWSRLTATNWYQPLQTVDWVEHVGRQRPTKTNTRIHIIAAVYGHDLAANSFRKT